MIDLNEAYKVYQDSGDKEALFSILSDYATSIVRKWGFPDPEDVTQEVMIGLLEILPSFNPDRGSFGPFIHGFILNRLRSQHRSSKSAIVPEQEPEEGIDSMLIEHAHDGETERKRNARHLPASIRKIAAMLKLGYSKQEIGSKLNLSVRRVDQIIADHVKTFLPA